MRIEGSSPRSYPIKRKPRKDLAQVSDDALDDIEDAEIVPSSSANSQRSEGGSGNYPVRQQDNIFPRSMSRRVAYALSSYMTTATFVDWDLSVDGFDAHV